jgi:DNA-binding NarL/FixJ family response regulator
MVNPDLVRANREILKEKLKLTHRQIDVMSEVSSGINNKQIGKKLFITEKTVKYHLTFIYRKLGVKNRMQAVMALADVVKPLINVKGK